MRCICQVRMTPAPPMMSEFHPLTHLLHGTEGDSNNKDIGNVRPPTQSVIVPDGVRQFILLPLWMVNDFNSTIKKKHFDAFREKY